MRRNKLFSILTVLCFTTWAPLGLAESLTIVIENIEVAEGKIMIQVMSGEEEFSGSNDPIASVLMRARTEEMRFSTSNLPAGEYAIRVMHDINDNNELDVNYVGMPKEPYAFSNNAYGNFGPPEWEDVKFALHGSITQKIQLVH